MKIAHIEIGENHKPFIIAEMSGNHNQSLERAFALVDAAAEAGAHALKLQTYTADTITLNIKSKDFFIEDKTSLWSGKYLHELYQQAYTPWEWHKPIFERARAKGMLAFSSPFDETSVDFLETLDVPCYKIASFENTHHPLLRKVAKTGKPVIMSTGIISIGDLDESVQVLKDAGCKELTILKCTSSYPASPLNTNLRTIPHMREMFNCEVGLSDHTMGIGASVAAIAFGARVIEKHFTLSREDGGVDSSFSLEPHELKALVIETERAWEALGSINYTLGEKEKKSLAHKRSIYISKDVKSGEVITTENIKIVRPAHGLPPKFYDFVLENKMKAIKDLPAGTALGWELIA